MILYRDDTHFRVGFHVLDVCLNDRRVAADHGDFVVLARDNLIDGLLNRGRPSASSSWRIAPQRQSAKMAARMIATNDNFNARMEFPLRKNAYELDRLASFPIRVARSGACPWDEASIV